MIRGFLLAGGLAVAATALLAEDHPKGLSPDAWTACHADPEPECLVDAGIAALREKPKSRESSNWLRPLLLFGRYDAVEDLLVLRSEGTDGTEAQARAVAAALRQQFELLRKLQAGIGLDEALEDAPDIEGAHLLTAAHDFIGRGERGFLDLSRGDNLSPSEREVVREIAARLLVWASADPPRAARHDLEDAAELYALLGDRRGVEAVLEAMPALGADPLHLSPEVMAVVGPETVLAMSDPGERFFPLMLLNAGTAEADPEQASRYFERAFERYVTDGPWPDFSLMLRVVTLALDRGLPEAAADLADRMAVIALEDPSRPFYVFHQLYAAEALLVTGAPRWRVTAMLALAEASFPGRPDKVIATGLISGRMEWAGSGLGDAAKGAITVLSARLGDHRTALRMLSNPEHPKWQWVGHLSAADLEVEVLEILYARLWESLPFEDAAYVSGQWIRQIASGADLPEDRKAWALRTARALAADPDARDVVASAVARIAFDAGDETLRQTALDDLARSALEQRNGLLLVEAAQRMKDDQSELWWFR